MSVIDVCTYGADNSGRTCSFDAVREAVAELKEGDTLFFPFGKYLGLQRQPIEITTSNIRIVGPAVLRGLMFSVQGACSPAYGVQDCGAKWVKLEDSNKLADSEMIQLFSSCNSFTDQVANYQSGSASPSSGILYDVRFSEIVQVGRRRGDSIDVDSDIIFPAYSAADFDKERVKSSWRALVPVAKIVFENLTFDMRGLKYFRSLQFNITSDCVVSSCEFIAEELPGRHVMARDSLRLRVENNLSRRSPSIDAKGSSWNSFLFGAGCQECSFEHNRVYGDWQAIDFTSFSDGEIEDANGIVFSWHTTQRIRIADNFFSNCHDGLTTHPGTYFASILNNSIVASSTGGRIRSRYNLVSGNQFNTKLFGLVFSSYFNDSLVHGNIFGLANWMDTSKWAGIGFLMTSQETFLGSPVKNVMITGNQFVPTKRERNIRAIEASHQATVRPDMEEVVSKSMGVEHDIVFITNMFNNLKSEIEPLVHGLNVRM